MHDNNCPVNSAVDIYSYSRVNIGHLAAALINIILVKLILSQLIKKLLIWFSGLPNAVCLLMFSYKPLMTPLISCINADIKQGESIY